MTMAHQEIQVKQNHFGNRNLHTDDTRHLRVVDQSTSQISQDLYSS